MQIVIIRKMKATPSIGESPLRNGMAAQPPGVRAPARAIDSSTLLAGAPAVTIRHNGAFYRLAATRAGKLILTK